MKPLLKYKENSGAAKESRYLCVFEGFSFNNLLIFDIETKKTKEKAIPIKTPLMRQGSLVTLLPDGELFCSLKGDSIRGSNTQGIAFILDKNYNVKHLINTEIFKTILGTIYYDGDVYAFGWDHPGLNKLQLKKYSLAKKRLSNIGLFHDRMAYLHCDIFENFTILTGNEERFICVYDIFSNSFMSLPLDLKAFSIKIVCSNDEKAYIISVSEGIYESKAFNPYEWIYLNTKNISSVNSYGVIANYKDCCYFLHEKNYYWFNFKDKTMNRVIRKLF